MSTETTTPQFRFKWSGLIYSTVQTICSNALQLPFLFPIGFKESFFAWLGQITGLSGPWLSLICSLLDFALVAVIIYAVLNLIFIRWGMKMVFLFGVLVGALVVGGGMLYAIRSGLVPTETVALITTIPVLITEALKSRS